MTIPEIQALRAELEVALRQAFTDFQDRTGLAVKKVDVHSLDTTRMTDFKRTSLIESVHVTLEAI